MTTQSAWQYNESGGSLPAKIFLNNTAPRPSTALAPDEVLVHVISAALNPVDVKVAEFGYINWAVKFPSTPGHDFCGRVVESGNAVDSLVDGQLVFGSVGTPIAQHGTLSEYIVVTTAGCVPLPSGVDPDDGAALGTAAITAYQCIVPYVKRGDKVFINGGSGGTGTFGIQIAKILGCTVTTSCSTQNVGLCESLGADEVVDYKTTDVSLKISSQGPIYDLVVDNVGTPSDLYVQANNFLKETGQFVQIAATPNLKSFGSVASRMLKPSFLGGGKRPFKVLSAVYKEGDFRELGEVIRVFLSVYRIKLTSRSG